MRTMQSLFRVGATAFALALLSPVAGAQAPADYPTKFVRIVVPFPTGGTADILARLIGERFTEIWGKPVIVENRPGAGGIIGTEAAAKSAADGYTFLIVTVGHAVNPSLYSRLPYNTETAFAPVGLVARMPNVVAVHPSVPAKSMQELIALARAKPGDILYGSPGNATTSHVATALFSRMANVQLTHVPYNGQPAAENALMAGQVHVLFNTIVGTVPQVKSGRMRALAVTTSKRSPLVPELPTVAEAGVPGYEFQAWFALLAPGATPAAIVGKVNQDLNRVLTLPVVKERLASLGAEPGGGSTDDLRYLLRNETQRWARVVNEANIKVE